MHYAQCKLVLVLMPRGGAPRIMKMMVSDAASTARNGFVIVACAGQQVVVSLVRASLHLSLIRASSVEPHIVALEHVEQIHLSSGCPTGYFY